VAAARKTPRSTTPAKIGAKPRPAEAPLPLSESDAFQTLQNDKLRRAQAELEAARDHYVDLYDFSPAGHLTLDTSGIIVESNLRAGALLGINRKELIGQSLARLFASDDQDIFHRHCHDVLKTGTRQTCELHLRKNVGASCWVYLESLAVHQESGRITHWRTALLDVSDRKRAELALRESEARLRVMLDHSPSLIFLKDLKGRYLDVNQQFERTFHLIRQGIIGKTDHDIFPPEQATAFRANDLKVLEAGRSLQFEEVALHDDGPHTSIVSKFPLRRLDGTPYAICGITTDITERKQTEKSLQNREREFHLLADHVPALYSYIDTELRYRFVNKRYEEFFGRPASGIVGKHIKDVVGEPNSSKIEPQLREALAGREVSFIYPMALPNGDARWMNVHCTPDGDDTGRIRGALVLVTDVTAQKQADLALQQSQIVLGEKREELQTLAEKLLTAQDEERKRIARELHDDFNQRLAALSVELESLERAPIAPPEPVARQLAVIRGQVGRLSDDLHDLAYKLHPSLLEHVGLEVAMRDHVAEFAKRTGLPVTFTAREVPETLSPEVATNLFRVMQESLQNVFKHAQATEVTVRLSGSSKGIGLSVRDNGKGFDLENKNARVKGLGLVSMQERARLLGGFLRIHSFPRDGTKVCAWIPRFQESA
jgi:PAS domain S-box-containing protein